MTIRPEAPEAAGVADNKVLSNLEIPGKEDAEISNHSADQAKIIEEISCKTQSLAFDVVPKGMQREHAAPLHTSSHFIRKAQRNQLTKHMGHFWMPPHYSQKST